MPLAAFARIVGHVDDRCGRFEVAAGWKQRSGDEDSSADLVRAIHIGSIAQVLYYGENGARLLEHVFEVAEGENCELESLAFDKFSCLSTTFFIEQRFRPASKRTMEYRVRQCSKTSLAALS